MFRKLIIGRALRLYSLVSEESPVHVPDLVVAEVTVPQVHGAVLLPRHGRVQHLARRDVLYLEVVAPVCGRQGNKGSYQSQAPCPTGCALS